MQIRCSKLVLWISVLCVFTEGAYAQSNLIFSKNNFKDVVSRGKNVTYDENNIILQCKSAKYEGLFDLFGNMNKISKTIPVGDFEVSYQYKTTETTQKSSLGMLYRTQHPTTKEFFTFSYLINQKGELFFYAEKHSSYKRLIPIKEYKKFLIPSYQKGEVKNNVMIQRKNRNWLLIINGDTIKNIMEPMYVNSSGTIKEEAPAPLDKFDSNVLLYQGKQRIIFYNCNQTFYAINEEFEKDIKQLEKLSGRYRVTPNCKEGNSSYVFDIEVTYKNDDFDHMVYLVGVTNQPKRYYLKKHTLSGVWYCDLNESDALIADGISYPIKKLYFYTSSPRISFAIEKREIKDNTMYSINCDYTGNKLK